MFHRWLRTSYRFIASLATAKVEDHTGRQCRCIMQEEGIDAALEAVTRIRLDTQLASGHSYRSRLKPCHLKEHAARRFCAARFLATDDTADAECFGLIGNNGDRVAYCIVFTIQRFKGLALAR